MSATDRDLCWLKTLSASVYMTPGNSCDQWVIMVQPAQNGESNDLTIPFYGLRGGAGLRDMLLNSLVRASAIQVRHIFSDLPIQVRLSHH